MDRGETREQTLNYVPSLGDGWFGEHFAEALVCAASSSLLLRVSNSGATRTHGGLHLHSTL